MGMKFRPSPPVPPARTARPGSPLLGAQHRLSKSIKVQPQAEDTTEWRLPADRSQGGSPRQAPPPAPATRLRLSKVAGKAPEAGGYCITTTGPCVPPGLSLTSMSWDNLSQGRTEDTRPSGTPAPA